MPREKEAALEAQTIVSAPKTELLPATHPLKTVTPASLPYEVSYNCLPCPRA